ncbi:MAG: AAA family ATPase [Symploca sp. SIO2E6]|nr:AAA family ATPase [Symploca sp. SIO2E6]
MNLKGGVGKTTTTIAIAEILAGVFRQKVLVIDLDPQTNATVMLIGEEKWEQLNDNHHTLSQLFLDATEPNNRKFDLEQTLQRKVSNVTDVETLDLLPSSLDLVDIQYKLATIPTGKFYALSPIDVLRRGIQPIINHYDYILIDCPPNLGIITLNGLQISHSYIIPAIPDLLSTYCIPHVIATVHDFSTTIGQSIEPLGIVISKYQSDMNLHERVAKELRRYSKEAPVFDTQIPQRQQIAAAAEYLKPHQFSTLKQKWGSVGQFQSYFNLTKEIIKRVIA